MSWMLFNFCLYWITTIINLRTSMKGSEISHKSDSHAGFGYLVFSMKYEFED